VSDPGHPLRVVHWYWQTGLGGIHRVVSDLVVSQQGDPSLAAHRVAGQVAPGVPGGGRVPGVTYLDLRHGFDFLRYGAARRAIATAHIVHMHVFNPVVAAAVVNLGRTCVYTDHGSDQHPSLRNRLVVFQLQRRFVRKWPARVTVNSGYRQGVQGAFYGIDAERIRVVPNGVDFASIAACRDPAARRAELGVREDELVVGTVAVFQMRKRIHLLLDAYARVRNSLMRPSRLVIVGDGPNRPALEREAHRLGISGHTIFAGYRQDALDVLALVDAFVLPTEGEAFGLAAVEALALGKPVIVWRDGGGLLEVVRHGESGFHVSDTTEAAARLKELLLNPTLRRRMGEAGAADVRSRFAISTMAERMRACYDEAVAAAQKRG
jgi:glycosyltransferase involved in cell wall biosynthesis